MKISNDIFVLLFPFLNQQNLFKLCILRFSVLGMNLEIPLSLEFFISYKCEQQTSVQILNVMNIGFESFFFRKHNITETESGRLH